MHVFFETACREGELADVLFFLSKGYPVNACNAAGMNALMLAADTGQMALSLLLLRFGANVDLTNANDQTASMIAQARGHVMLAKLLCGKPERRLKCLPVPKRACTTVGHAALLQLLEYGVRRGFLSDAQIHQQLPALREEPTGFSVVCQALQSLGIVLRDRTPNLDHFAQPLRQCSDLTSRDINEYAKSVLNNLQISSGPRRRVAYTYPKPEAARPLILKSQRARGTYWADKPSNSA
jgi:hypothetical protein